MSPVADTGEMNFSPCSIGNICRSANVIWLAESYPCLGSLMSGSAGGRTNTSCLIDPNGPTSLSDRPLITLRMCGNGIVEEGEDCDPGVNSNSSCCDASTCRFRNGAVCDPDSSPCCTDSCAFAPSTQVCRPSKDDRCDSEERCTGDSAQCPQDVFAPNGQSCGDGSLACATGTCTSLDRAFACLASGYVWG